MMRHFSVAVLLLALSLPATAQEAPEARFDLELNAMQPGDDGCKVTFLATNGLGAPLARAAVETALFDRDGAIARIVTLEFKELAVGKTKVLQFSLKGLACEGIGRILINDVTACEGEGLGAAACLAGLRPTTLPAIAFGL